MYTPLFFSFFFFNDTATTEIYTLSLHDALPIYRKAGGEIVFVHRPVRFSTAALARRNEGKFWLIAETLFCCDRPVLKPLVQVDGRRHLLAIYFVRGLQQAMPHPQGDR